MPDLKDALAVALGNDFRGEIRHGEDLGRQSYLGIGGPADHYVAPADALSLKRCLLLAGERKMPVFVLGGGTNVLIPDEGFRGMVISLKHFTMKKMINEQKDSAEIFVEAGVALPGLIGFCGEHGYSGLEGLAGIPGTVGGAIAGNSGAYGQEIKDVARTIVVMFRNGTIRKLETGEFSLGYRRSFVPENPVILSANMLFRRGKPETVKEAIRTTIMKKKAAQPVWERSLGCVFKNPQGEAAWQLIESAGCRGLRVGDIEVSDLHANFFINRGQGRASDYLELMRRVKQAVQDKSGVDLEPEIRIIRND